MAIIALVRHGLTDTVVRETIAGRLADAPLNERGRAQAAELADRLASAGLHAVYASPLPRAQQTAGPIAERLGLPLRSEDGLLEIDFGAWTGRAVAALREEPEWRAFHEYRTGTRVPGGELLLQAQARVVDALERLRATHAGERVVAVSHADPIRLALSYYLGAPLELMLRLQIDPASVSVLQLETWGAMVWGINHQGPRPL